MHGQKKRRKRTLDGSIVLDGNTLSWSLLSEPLWSTEHGFVGLRIAVKAEDGAHRELILEYPYPKTKGGSELPLPQRPPISGKTVESDTRQAMAAGWDPNSRGKTFIHHVINASS
jgi:hypothetical protein